MQAGRGASGEPAGPQPPWPYLLLQQQYSPIPRIIADAKSASRCPGPLDHTRFRSIILDTSRLSLRAKALSQVLSPRSVKSPRRTKRERRWSTRAAAPVHVVVAWSAAGALDAASPVRVELEAEHRAGAQPRWTCQQPLGWSWEDAISAAGCQEVELTAQLDDDLEAKNLVLSLADQLTQQLSATHPMIRVRFLPGPNRSAEGSTTNHGL